MKKLFLSVTCLFVSVISFANNDDNLKNFPSEKTKVLIQKKNMNTEDKYVIREHSFLTVESCTITEVRKVVSDGIAIYTEINLFHIDGMSCETFFNNLTMIGKGLSKK